MLAGKLRHKITVQTSTDTLNGYGEPVESWATYKILMASIQTTGAREFNELNKTYGELSHLIKVRHVSGITSKMRILFDGRTLEIIAPPINLSSADRTLNILCRELEA